LEVRFYVKTLSIVQTGVVVSFTDLIFVVELGEEATSPSMRIIGAVVTCVPFDPVAGQMKLDTGFSRAVYSENFLLTLKAKAELQNTRYPGKFDIVTVRNCRSIGDFDNAFIAPVFGYTDKVDYYRKTGSKWWLDKIRTCVIAINALDDPFIEESSLPVQSELPTEASVRLIYHEYGGHCGFYSSDGSEGVVRHGWLAEELARAVEHIHHSSSAAAASGKALRAQL
jgi:predicted alpha/beta-fold hydrolase